MDCRWIATHLALGPSVGASIGIVVQCRKTQGSRAVSVECGVDTWLRIMVVPLGPIAILRGNPRAIVTAATYYCLGFDVQPPAANFNLAPASPIAALPPGMAMRRWTATESKHCEPAAPFVSWMVQRHFRNADFF